MQAWFSKFIRGRTFSVLFCILGIGLTLYLSNRLGALISGFCSLNFQPILLLILSAICIYMLI